MKRVVFFLFAFLWLASGRVAFANESAAEVTVPLLNDVLEELDDINGVEILRSTCPDVFGEADVSRIEPVCLQMLELPEGFHKMDNCQEAFRRVPNKDALRWTFSYFLKNLGGIKDQSCFVDDHSIDSLGVGTKKWRAAAKEKGISTLRFEEVARTEWKDMAKNRGLPLKDLKQDIAKRGIENSCQIMMNDFSDACGKDKEGPFGYWIDLCGDTEDAVRTYVVKMGTGTCASGFNDEKNKKSTIIGPFLSGEVSNHNPYKMNAAYKALKNAGVLKKVVVFGLNESNNDSFWDKHVHVSPYFTSSGCPAVNKKDVDLIYELGKSQALIMNYGPEKFQKDVDSCHNGNGGKE
jgi:hypothetical protein